jgi:hypothetical protein
MALSADEASIRAEVQAEVERIIADSPTCYHAYKQLRVHHQQHRSLNLAGRMAKLADPSLDTPTGLNDPEFLRAALFGDAAEAFVRKHGYENTRGRHDDNAAASDEPEKRKNAE